MTEAEWLAGADFEWLFDGLEEMAPPSQRKLRLFEVACCQRFADRMPEPVLVNALDVAERFADDLATRAELAAVHEAARDLEDESAMPSGDFSVGDAVHFGAKAVVSATSPDAADYHAGTYQVIESVIAALIYAHGSIQTKGLSDWVAFEERVRESERKSFLALVHDSFGNPFRPVTLDPHWQSETVVALAAGIYDERAFDRMPILADALEEAGCDHADVLAHCRGDGPHVRGCWVVDLVLGKS